MNAVFLAMLILLVTEVHMVLPSPIRRKYNGNGLKDLVIRVGGHHVEVLKIRLRPENRLVQDVVSSISSLSSASSISSSQDKDKLNKGKTSSLNKKHTVDGAFSSTSIFSTITSSSSSEGTSGPSAWNPSPKVNLPSSNWWPFHDRQDSSFSTIPRNSDSEQRRTSSGSVSSTSIWSPLKGVRHNKGTKNAALSTTVLPPLPTSHLTEGTTHYSQKSKTGASYIDTISETSFMSTSDEYHRQVSPDVTSTSTLFPNTVFTSSSESEFQRYQDEIISSSTFETTHSSDKTTAYGIPTTHTFVSTTNNILPTTNTVLPTTHKLLPTTVIPKQTTSVQEMFTTTVVPIPSEPNRFPTILDTVSTSSTFTSSESTQSDM